MVFVLVLLSLVFGGGGYTYYHQVFLKDPRQIAARELAKAGIPVSPESLLAAAERGDSKTAHWLLLNDVSPNAADASGKTALMIAAARGDLSFIQTLAESPALEISKTHPSGLAAIHAALQNGRIEVAVALRRMGSTEPLPLVDAVKVADTALINDLIDQAKKPETIRALVNEPDPQGLSPLFWAVSLGHREISETLIRLGADVNFVSPHDGRTALIVAASNNAVELIHTLLSNKADIEAKDRQGRTALLWAIATSNTNSAYALMQRGANRNAVNPEDGLTALGLAVHKNLSGIIGPLLDSGADPLIKDKQGLTPVEIAFHLGRFEIMEMILRKSTKTYVDHPENLLPLLEAARAQKLGKVELFLDNYAKGSIPE
ncbi:MAG: ankyrin repeat domain-containing protein [Verrucomicrobiae bacterium]|nr:ankyrin repeat domain-containing protein [Verrucomicrobiae bacterium]